MSLNPLSYREVKRKLESAGFSIISQKGSHVKFIKYTEQGSLITIVPYHKEIAIGTIRSILRQTGLSIKQFELL